jgi:hypothetical protein
MSNKQQTAVEWLVEQFKEYDFADVKDTENYIIKMQSFVLTEKLEKAKEMDKENMIEFAYNALKIADNTTNRYVDVDELYDKLYGGNTHEE